MPIRLARIKIMPMSNNGKDTKIQTHSSIIDKAINGQKVIGEVSQYRSRY